MRISDWSSDVCSSDLSEGMADYELVEYLLALAIPRRDTKPLAKALLREFGSLAQLVAADPESLRRVPGMGDTAVAALKIVQATSLRMLKGRSEEHTSELQSLMRISYAVFCLKQQKTIK